MNLLKRISNNEEKEDLKEEERENKKRAILTLLVRSSEIQHQLMNSNLKKEKIWYENATSFLRYLLKKDRKLLLFKMK